jgi:2-isopropylmalate synthase
VGVSENVVEASWQALVDSLEYKLYKDESPSKRRKKG